MTIGTNFVSCLFHQATTRPAVSLPDYFTFNQSNLQDFLICPRRFELCYLRQLRWPCIEVEPLQESERLSRLGNDFHRLVHQHLLGLDVTTLTDSLVESEAELKDWWCNYLDYQPVIVANAQAYPELTLSTMLNKYRLLARFDLLTIDADGTFLLVDWKTSWPKPSRYYLAQHLQTRVYPYVLAKAGAYFNGGHLINPTAIKLMYWYPQIPDQPEVFDYSVEQFKQDEEFLGNLIGRIKSMTQDNSFPPVADNKPCLRCTYHSYCGRGDKASSLTEQEETIDVNALEWGQIAEIEYW